MHWRDISCGNIIAFVLVNNKRDEKLTKKAFEHACRLNYDKEIDGRFTPYFFSRVAGIQPAIINDEMFGDDNSIYIAIGYNNEKDKAEIIEEVEGFKNRADKILNNI